MTASSHFLDSLINKPVRITVVDEQNLPPLPPLTLREVSSLGVVAEDSKTTHFFPWNEIVEISPRASTPAPVPDQDLVEAALEVDSEV